VFSIYLSSILKPSPLIKTLSKSHFLNVFYKYFVFWINNIFHKYCEKPNVVWFLFEWVTLQVFHTYILWGHMILVNLWHTTYHIIRLTHYITYIYFIEYTVVIEILILYFLFIYGMSVLELIDILMKLPIENSLTRLSYSNCKWHFCLTEL